MISGSFIQPSPLAAYYFSLNVLFLPSLQRWTSSSTSSHRQSLAPSALLLQATQCVGQGCNGLTHALCLLAFLPARATHRPHYQEYLAILKGARNGLVSSLSLHLQRLRVRVVVGVVKADSVAWAVRSMEPRSGEALLLFPSHPFYTRLTLLASLYPSGLHLKVPTCVGHDAAVPPGRLASKVGAFRPPCLLVQSIQLTT